MAALRNEVLALIQDLRKRTPLERLIAIAEETEKDRWDIEPCWRAPVHAHA